MADLHKAEAAARESERRYLSVPSSNERAHEAAAALSHLLAALDAARGEAIGEVTDERRDVGGYTAVIRWDGGDHPGIGTKLFAAPPAALAVPEHGHVEVLRELSATLIGRSHERYAAVEWALQQIAKQAQQPAAAVPANFAEWLAREMPAGTVIGDPHWWARLIARRFAQFAATQAPPAAVPAETREHVARLLELSDRHLTGGEFAIQRGNVYWQAQAQVAIDALAAALAERVEVGRDK